MINIRRRLMKEKNWMEKKIVVEQSEVEKNKKIFCRKKIG